MRKGALLPASSEDRQYSKDELVDISARHLRGYPELHLVPRTEGSFVGSGFYLPNWHGTPEVVQDERGEYVLVFVKGKSNAH